MTLDFFKAHAYGNDFLCAPVDQTTNLECQQLARRICDRHVGVGLGGDHSKIGQHSGPQEIL